MIITRKHVTIWDSNIDMNNGYVLKTNYPGMYGVYMDKFKDWKVVEVEDMNGYAAKVLKTIYRSSTQKDVIFCADKILARQYGGNNND